MTQAFLTTHSILAVQSHYTETDNVLKSRIRQKVIVTVRHQYVFLYYFQCCDGIIRGSSHPILEIFLTASMSMILIFLPSIATIFSAANAESVRMALAVVMLDRLARSSLVR